MDEHIIDDPAVVVGTKPDFDGLGTKPEKKKRTMEEIIFNETLMQHFEYQNKVGLAEHFLFSKEIDRYFDSSFQLNRTLNQVLAVCEYSGQINPYQVSAKNFVRLITYKDFKARRGVSEAMAISLRLYMLHQCGVDWLKPGNIVIGF